MRMITRSPASRMRRSRSRCPLRTQPISLIDPTGATVLQQDGSGQTGGNAVLTYTMPAVLPGSGGIYTIEATSSASGATGAYAINMECASGASVPGPSRTG